MLVLRNCQKALKHSTLAYLSIPWTRMTRRRTGTRSLAVAWSHDPAAASRTCPTVGRQSRPRRQSRRWRPPWRRPRECASRRTGPRVRACAVPPDPRPSRSLAGHSATPSCYREERELLYIRVGRLCTFLEFNAFTGCLRSLRYTYNTGKFKSFGEATPLKIPIFTKC